MDINLLKKSPMSIVASPEWFSLRDSLKISVQINAEKFDESQ